MIRRLWVRWNAVLGFALYILWVILSELVSGLWGLAGDVYIVTRDEVRAMWPLFLNTFKRGER